MIYIAHRGNIDGPNPNGENDPLYIMEALKLGYDAEVDVRCDKLDFMLGHDYAKYKVDIQFLLNPKIWCHAKDIITFYRLIISGAHTFFHDKDDVVLTTKKYLWTFPSKYLTRRSIAVLPEICDSDYTFWNAAGICSDYIKTYKQFGVENGN